MKNLKRTMMAGLLTVAMALGVLGSVTPAEAATLTAKQYLTKMEKATKKAKSYEVTQTATVKGTSSGQNFTTKSTTKQIIFQDPLKSKSVVTTTTQGDGVEQKSKVVTYLKEDSKGNIYAYVSTDGSDYEEMDMTELYSSASEVDTDTYIGAKIVKKSVKVNKIDTVQISAKLDMAKALEQLGLGADQSEELELDFSKLKPAKVTVWIDKKTYQPVKVVTDSTDFTNSYLQCMFEAMGVETEGSYSVSKTTTVYKNFNKATKFSLPEAAK